MNDHNKAYLERQLNKIYLLMNGLSEVKTKGTLEYEIMYELENINTKLDIPFKD